MDIKIRLASEDDIDLLEQLYDNTNDYLASTVNYTGWKKGVYPARQDAIDGVNSNSLFVAVYGNEIVGSIVLIHKSEQAYAKATWQAELEDSDIFVIHTFIVNPKYRKYGIGQKLLQFADEFSVETKTKSLRLDVYENNIPAINLYEKCGYKYIDTVSLGLEEFGLDWFMLYEKLL